jgi:hypothetical protein
MAKMPETTGEVRCTVHVMKRRAFSFAVPLARVAVGSARTVLGPDGRRTASVSMRAGLTRRVRVLILALRVLAFMRVRVDVEA